MNLFGIEFAPFNIPIERRLQTLAAGSWFIVMMFGGTFGTALTIYVLLYTKYWFPMILYLIWAYTVDFDSHEKGGRSRVDFMRQLGWWKSMKDYFPLTVKKASNFQLDAKKNYLFCCYPHGVFSAGVFLTFATDVTEFNDLFPYHKATLLTLKEALCLPLHREFLYILGGCSATAKSIKWLLGYPGGGNVVALVIGGAEEATYAKAGNYVVVLKKRKGFVRLALQTGAPLVPVFSFGEIDIFGQVENSRLRKFQQFVKSKFRVNPIIVKGRGLLQYSFGMVPFRKPIRTIIGEPIEVPQIENPTQEEIDEVHATFTKKLTELFETHKHEYLQNADETNLIIT